MSNRIHRQHIIAPLLLLLSLHEPATACSTSAWAETHGNPSATKQARFEAECGLRLNLDGSAASWVKDDTPGSASPPVDEYGARFYLNADDASLPAGARITLFRVMDSSSSELIRVVLEGTGSGKRVILESGTGSNLAAASPVPLPAGWRAVAVSWNAASRSATLSLDGRQQSRLADARTGSGTVGSVMLGAIEGNASTIAGFLDFDAFASSRYGAPGVVAKACTARMDNMTFLPGVFQCRVSGSLTFGHRIVFDPGAQVKLSASTVAFSPGFRLPHGATLSMAIQ